MTPGAETAAAVFARINRRRSESAGSASHPDVPRGPAGSGGLGAPPIRARVDEVLFRDPVDRFPRGAAGLGDDAAMHPAAAEPPSDRFPRSATMKLVLRHPALALGLGVPAAALLLKSPASRRLLGMAVRIGTGPELQQLMRLSSGAVAAAAATQPDPDKPFP